jgi:DNA mismatch endonuclease, patch repair protein
MPCRDEHRPVAKSRDSGGWTRTAQSSTPCFKRLPNPRLNTAMVDRFTPDQRSKMMAAIRSRDTVPERKVRSIAHRLGFRFTLRRKDLPGRPDLVFPRLKAVIFVHGCFWHRHADCSRSTSPATNRAFWEAKFNRNVSRDAEALARLGNSGWKTLVVWECELREHSKLRQKIRRFLQSSHLKVLRSLTNVERQKSARRT